MESTILALLGSTAGAVLALWLTQLLIAQLDTPFEYVNYALDVRPDLRVLTAAAMAAVGAAVLCGLAPVRAVGRLDLRDLVSQGPIPGRAPGPARLFNVLVIVQLAASTVLLLGAGVVARSYLQAQDRSLGIETRGLISGTLTLSHLALGPSREDGRLMRLADRIARVPGIAGIALSRESFLGTGRSVPVTAEPPSASTPSTLTAMEFGVSATYFQVVGLQITHGQGLDDREMPNPRRVVVNRALAQRLAGDGSPIGQRFTRDGDTEYLEVVGVVSDLHRASAQRPPVPTFYRTLRHDTNGQVTAIVRAHGPLSTLLGDVRRAVHAVDADIAVADLQSVDALLDVRARQQRLPTLVFGLVGSCALLLSTVGLFGVMAYGVRTRAREIGVRQALGASPADIRQQVLRRGFAVVGVALLAGLGVAGAARAAAGSTVFGLAHLDINVVTLVSGVLLLASALALYLPARWAARIDPAAMLRRS